MSSTEEEEEVATKAVLRPRTSRLNGVLKNNNNNNVPFSTKPISNGHDPGEGCSSSNFNGRVSNKLPKSRFLTNNYSGSSSETEDDHCVYKYKGNSVDSLSLENLQMREIARVRSNSPETDYLEMDFEPGVSNGQECSDDSDCCDMGELGESGKSDQEAEEDEVPRAPSPSPVPDPCKPSEVEIPSIPLKDVEENVPSETESERQEKIFDFMNQSIKFQPGMMAKIWNDIEEARENQVCNISSPSTGITAVINTLLSLKIDFKKEDVIKSLEMCMKKDITSIPEYLFMRSSAGRRSEDLVKTIKEVSKDQLICRFFPTYPWRMLNLSAFLFYWIEKGAVPIVTFDPELLECFSNNTVWHHRMVWCVAEKEIYLLDPIECVPTNVLLERLSRPSSLIIEKEDILSRWRPDSDLSPLLKEEKYTWKQLNVLGQVVNIIREFMRGGEMYHKIEIPADFTSGITLVIPRDSPHVTELFNTPEIPLASFPGAEVTRVYGGRCPSWCQSVALEYIPPEDGKPKIDGV